MFRHMTGLTKATSFYGLTFGLALAVALLTRGGDGGIAEILSMLTPTVGLLLMLLVVTRDGRARDAWRSLGLGRLGAGHVGPRSAGPGHRARCLLCDSGAPATPMQQSPPTGVRRILSSIP